ncbi:hypothetical protein AAC387_Pa08g1305 [Persea americana]
MSVIWTYITAEELVALLLALGNIIGIGLAILGLTVLAWGNSVGDVIANVAMAINGGLGLSLVRSSWHEYPSAYVVPIDASLYLLIWF